MNLKSTYGIRKDFSFHAEEFFSVSLSWRAQIDILKIRIAKWKPHYSRANSAIFYYDVQTTEEAKEIIQRFEDFDFKAVEKDFEKMFAADTWDKGISLNTGQTAEWSQNFLLIMRKKYEAPQINADQ